ncbi:MAG: binding-protein-dependent transport system inner rane component, partial [Lachnospiraceae bacterium]|nr:binding-protein-dependent transport system inner rane component [Lachnospiraceae bacterium]
MSKKIKNIALYLFLIIGVIMIAYPIYLTIITSMKTPQELSKNFFALP